jgi:ribosomal protein S18 acetylase RimI-like enzyme
VDDVPITIERGLPEHLREQAVSLFEEAFGEKMRIAVRDRTVRMAFKSRAYDARHVVIARRGDRLLGMVGLSTRSGAFAGGLMDVGWDPRAYRDLLGWLGAAWAVWGLHLSDHRPKDDELYVDGLAVAATERSQGIGTRLLDEVTGIAREQAKRYVRLHVVDTNPRARALYERLGFTVTRVQSFRYKQRLIGFGAMISMERRVDGGQGADPQAGGTGRLGDASA